MISDHKLPDILKTDTTPSPVPQEIKDDNPAQTNQEKALTQEPIKTSSSVSSDKIEDKKPYKITGRFYDMDHCLLAGYAKTKRVNQSLYSWFLENRKELLEQEIDYMEKGEFTTVVIGSFSNRQSHEIDNINIEDYSTCSFSPILLILAHYFSSVLPGVMFFIDNYMMADSFGNEKNGGVKTSGDSYKLILKSQYAQEEKVKDTQEEKAKDTQHVFFEHGDKEKFLNFYTCLHRLALLNPPDAELHAAFFDDKEKYLYQSVITGQASGTKLLPECTVDRFIYTGKGQAEGGFDIIKGTGEPDTHYHWTTRLIFNERHFPTDVSAFSVLEQQLDNNQLLPRRDVEPSRTTLKSNEMIDKFLKGRNEYISSKSTLKESYSTLEQLIAEKCITLESLTKLGIPYKQSQKPVPTQIHDELPKTSQTGLFSGSENILNSPTEVEYVKTHISSLNLS